MIFCAGSDDGNDNSEPEATISRPGHQPNFSPMVTNFVEYLGRGRLLVLCRYLCLERRYKIRGRSGTTQTGALKWVDVLIVNGGRCKKFDDDGPIDNQDTGT